MKTHSNTLQRSSLSKQVASHQNPVMSESHSCETRDPKETSLGYENHSISAVDYSPNDGLHSSEIPYIVNVKQEEDI